MRKQSELSYRRRINRVVAHIHAHLDGELSGEVLAGLATLSRYHFHRIFAAMTGMTPATYVLQVRLDTAVNTLRARRTSVSQIALDCGFESGTALAKALRKRYGLSPSAIRQALIDPRHDAPRAWPRSSIRHRRPQMLTPTIKTLADQQVLCATARGTIDNDMGQAAKQAFGALIPAAAALGVTPRTTACIAIFPDEPKGPNDPDARFVAGFVFDGEAPPLDAHPGLHLTTLPGGRWAVFRHIGPYDTLWQTWRAVYRDWVPRAGVELRDQPPYERYINEPTDVPPQELITDIYVPLV